MKRFRTQAGRAMILALAALGGAIAAGHAAPTEPVQPTELPARTGRAVASYAPVVKKAAPSVVNIFTSRTVAVRVRSPLQENPFLRGFFGDQFDEGGRTRTEKESSLGSGVIVSADGYILTANHVVEDADAIKVAVNGSGQQYTAKIIGRDKLSDVAVLKIQADHLPAIALADSAQLEVGDVVLAIGDPYGVGQTVTMGIVSALGRNGLGFGQYEDFIQTDAAVNPGNSGGALVDAEGRLVGINTAIFSESGGNVGIGFAVPINLARHVMDQLISSGKVSRGFMGVRRTDLTPDLASEFGVPGQTGVLVEDVSPNSPAQQAGIKSGDIILSVNGKAVPDANSFSLTVAELPPGTTAEVSIIRDGRPKTIQVVLGALPSPYANAEAPVPEKDNGFTTDSLAGVSVSDLDRRIRRELGMPANLGGVVVVEIADDSNAAEAGLLKWDVIAEIDRHEVGSADEAISQCKRAKADHILLKVWRRESANAAGWRYISVDNTKPR